MIGPTTRYASPVRQHAGGSGGAATPPFAAGTGAGTIVALCPRWKLRLIDEAGRPMTGRKYQIDAPVSAEGALNAMGETQTFSTGTPSDGNTIDVLFKDFKVLPELGGLWGSFPDMPWDKVAGLIGGTVLSEATDYYQRTGSAYNACTLRMSRSFNYSGQSGRYFADRHIQQEISGASASAAGHSIPSGALGVNLRRLKGGDGRAYAMRVAEFGPYLSRFYPDAAVTRTTAADIALFRGYPGVMQMDISWGDATGHYALWNGTRFRREDDDYFDPSHRGSGVWRGAKMFHFMEIRFVERTSANGICTFTFVFRKIRSR